jgi:hypothetical protein
MTTETFLNHLYYSYASLDRTLLNEEPYGRDSDARDRFASLLFTFTLGRYFFSIAYFLIIIPMHLIGIQFSAKMELCFIAFLGCPLLSFVNSKYICPVYNRYFKEFYEDKNYNKAEWNLLAFSLWFFSYCLFYLVLCLSQEQ